MTARKISRRKFLAGVGASGAVLAGYAYGCEPHWMDTSRHEILTGAGGKPIKILHLADLHASWCVTLSFIERAIERGLQLRPDLICVTGDFITSRFDDAESYSRILSGLGALAPTFACLGNHDGGDWAGCRGGYATIDWISDLLRKSGITLLHNRSADMQVRGRPIRLIGIGDHYANETAPAAAFAGASPSRPPYCIVLAHNPDSKEMLAPYPWDLMLCGHTHGGQICLPFFGPPYLPVKDRRFVAGMYAWENRRIHITKGVGNILGLRFNCRPEISLLTLT